MREFSMAAVDRPHIVCVPYPAQSHIGAMVKLAKLLHLKGFCITFVNMEHDHNRILKARGPNSLDGLPGFQFVALSGSLPPSEDASTIPDRNARIRSSQMSGLAPFLSLLDKLGEKTGTTPVTCILSDGFVAFTLAAAHRLGVPVVSFWTFSACSFMGFYQLPVLVQKGLTPLKDESYLSNGHMDTVIDWIPGMKDIRLKNLPSVVRVTDLNDVFFKLCSEAMERSTKVSANIIHTFDALERDLIDALSTMVPSLYAIGPLELLLSQVSQEKEEEGQSNQIGFNLWKEESVCLEWLDSKESNSVIYVNFGSLVQLTIQQLVEIGWGLANSHCNFLWIIRPDLVTGETSLLPQEFEAETKERGLIASWCAQKEVLNHPAVGGFFTHCGWSSTIESLSAGVPMICWPFFGDQQTNCHYVCSEWMTGMEMDDTDVKRETVEKLVRELMGGEEGVKLRKKAMEWKKLAEEDTSEPDGPSNLAFENLVKKLKFLSFGR